MASREIKKVIVRDKMQSHYEYDLVEPMGKLPKDFQPDLTPDEMLKLGVFGGVYMRDCRNEFPADWFQKAKLQEEGVYTQDPRLNYFKINASQSLSVWRKKGWINEDVDPRGWFQWYCRYYMGRRLPEEDEKQIKRWRAIARHVAQIKKNCRKEDKKCRPKQRQALLHWAYDSITM